MTLDIDGDGKSRDVGGGDLAGDTERGHVAAEPLRPDIQGVDLLERLFLDGGDILAFVLGSDVARQRLFREEGAGVKRSADPDAHIHGRAGARARNAHRLHDGVYDALSPFGRCEHIESAHVFASESLG